MMKYEATSVAVGEWLWPFDAEMRGYDMTLFKGPWRSHGRLF